MKHEGLIESCSFGSCELHKVVNELGRVTLSVPYTGNSTTDAKIREALFKILNRTVDEIQDKVIEVYFK